MRVKLRPGLAARIEVAKRPFEHVAGGSAVVAAFDVAALAYEFHCETDHEGYGIPCDRICEVLADLDQLLPR